MTSNSRPSPRTSNSGGGPPAKRARVSSPDQSVPVAESPRSTEEGDVPSQPLPEKTGSKAGQSSSFRNVSACNRCRLRKNRCDQRLPSCASCEKANVKCVGYDPITKREIPRSYVFYLESRAAYLEKVLEDNGIPFAPADVLEHASRPGADSHLIQTPSDDGRQSYIGSEIASSSYKNNPMPNLGNVSIQGASDSRHLGSATGISFARVVFAAVKSSVSGSTSDKSGVRPSRPPISSKAAGPGTGGTSMRESFFGLHTKPMMKQAPLPSKELGGRLVNFYFEHANPQIPILHRGEFMKMFELAYAEGDARVRTARELFMLNIVFAIGAGIFLGDSSDREKKDGLDEGKDPTIDQQYQPEEYHASAIIHLEPCLDRPEGFGSGLDELQYVLLLAGFALLRPVAPGLWYIIGVAVRLAVDLGLHHEDGKDVDVGLEDPLQDVPETDLARQQKLRTIREKGRREWIRDFRRRLWWCAYSFDRLVSTCVGRPFGISDQVITTEFPSLLDDKYITPAGFQQPLGVENEPSYKHAAYHYFRLRLLQSEILQVLQHQQAQQARAGGANQRNPYMHTALPSPFLAKFGTFRSWRIDIDKRLWEWKESAPTKQETGVAFSIEFLELNYWQCVIMLYRQSLSVPQIFEGEFNTSNEVDSPNVHNVELREDEERVFVKVAEAGQRVLRLYRKLHRVHLVNYTFLATHHLFMAGISFLYAIWHSPIVRSRLTLDEVDFTILAATSVLGDLIEKCPPAEACRDAFDRMSKATVNMCMSTTGFSSSVGGINSGRYSSNHRSSNHNRQDSTEFNNNRRPSRPRPKPQFDMGLNDLLGPTTPTYPSIKTEFEMGGSFRGPGQSAGAVHSSPPEYVVSPTISNVDASVIDPSLLPSPSAPPTSAFPPNSFPTMTTTAPNPYPPQQVMDFSFANAPGMDFLNNGAAAVGNGNNGWSEMGAAGGGVVDGGWNGDLGLGLGWEGADHDFSEGGNGGVDLFDGFFFGGTGGF
ncbi:hypothetical protein HYFRA_00013741 [Hymenoscyphus fraxineus]|uniref:Zn(2)-C6 fungal-type domain-containing protein n=1 Tax=Hymenoscyphus fraxineus TaxID=746836 RepID=A0A9N9L801_9HELO|nr:hypothetical protein HYFRA_00013741 [Hymenoscyphus fraxineus]